MPSDFILYGCTGFVGEATARLAVQSGLRPIIAGRNGVKVRSLAAELGVAFRVFSLDDTIAVDRALNHVSVVLNCAGPFLYTSKPIVDACLRTGAHYLDITGEIPIYQALAARNAESKSQGIMLLPGVGFDVVPTDCLSMHLKQRLPSATHLTLAFYTKGPAGLPPGTQKTMIELIPYGNLVRRDGRLETPERLIKNRMVDFGHGPVEVTRLTWGDLFMAYYSTGIPNIEDYAMLSEKLRRQMIVVDYIRPLFNLSMVRNLFKRGVTPGSSSEKRAKTSTHIWGEVKDDQGRSAVSRLHGPEAGVIWTTTVALAAVQKALAGNAPPGFQTPALAYGANFVLECGGVTREDL